MLWGVSITKLANAVITLRRATLQEKYDMLFEAWDYNLQGKIAFSDIDRGLKKLQASSDETHVEAVWEAALKALPELSASEDQTFDRAAFKQFAETLTQEMGQPFSIVSELLILGALEIQPREDYEVVLLKEIQGRADEQLKTEEMNKELSEDPTVRELFQCFNTSNSGRLSFLEVAYMLRKLRKDVSLRECRAEAVKTMLLLDTESERSLGAIEFARFLQKIGVLMCLEPRVLAETLLDIARQEPSFSLDDSATSLMMESQGPVSQVYETLADRRLHLLFELWDKDGDGLISFAELTLGLRKFSPLSEPATETASDAAEALLVFDSDSDQRLDWPDFARFINHFCEACGSDFGTLSEYLILLAALEDNPSEELAFLLSEDTVERAIVDVDNTWRKSLVSLAEPSHPQQGNPPTERSPFSTSPQGSSPGGRSEPKLGRLQSKLSLSSRRSVDRNDGPESPVESSPFESRPGTFHSSKSTLQEAMRLARDQVASDARGRTDE